MLLLKRHLVELVRAGKKRQTIRLWSRPLLRPGQISYTPGLGKMLITAVDQLTSLSDLTEADAIADGFDNLKSLMAEIRRIYGATIPKNRNVYRIQFQWPHEGAHVAPPPARSTGFSPKKKTAEPKHEVTKTRRPTKKIRQDAPIPTTPARRTTAAMTRPQREALRNFIVAKSPRTRSKDSP
jgi:hypothetical protein